MVLETKIQAQIVAGVDKQSFDKAEQIARDTGKAINQSLKVKLEMNIAELQVKLQQVKSLLKDKDLSTPERIRLQLDANQLQRGLTEAKRNLNNLLNTGDATLSRLQQKFNGLAGVVSTAKIAVGSFIGSLGASIFQKITSGITSFAESIVTLGAKLEQTKVAFTTMLGGAEEAESMLRKLADFASKTPFEINGVRDTAKQLLAFGFSANEIIPTLKALGDVSAGLSVPIEQIAYAYGQVRSANQLYGTELRQFVNAGVPLLAELAKMFGKTEAQVKKMVENGQVGFKDVEEAFRRMSSEGGKFENLMEKQSKTVSGAWSNFKDTLTITAETIGVKIAPALTSLIGGLTSVTQSIKDVVTGADKMKIGMGEVEEKIKANALAQEELNKSFKDGAISADTYRRKLKELKEEEENLKEEAKFTALSVYEIEEAINGINKSNLSSDQKVAELKKVQIQAEQTLSTLDRLLAKLEETRKELGQKLAEEKKQTEAGTRSLGGAGAVSTADQQRYLLVSAQILSTTQETVKARKALQSLDKTINPQKPTTKTQGTGGKSKQKTDAEELKKMLKEVSDIQDEITKKGGVKIDMAPGIEKNKESLRTFIDGLKAYGNSVEQFAKQAGSAYDELGRKIDSSKEKQEGLKEDIASIEKDIAGRVVEIDSQISELSKKKVGGLFDQEDIETEKRLNEERAKAFEGLSPEKLEELKKKIKEIAEFEKLSEVERLQKKLALKQQELDAEKAQEEEFNKQRKAILADYEAYLADSVAKEASMAEQLKTKWIEVANARSKAMGSSSSLPGRANGGPVSSGSPYIVGERGPELFVPQNSGRIVPNHSLTVNQNVNANVASNIDINVLADRLARKISLADKGIK